MPSQHQRIGYRNIASDTKIAYLFVPQDVLVKFHDPHTGLKFKGNNNNYDAFTIQQQRLSCKDTRGSGAGGVELPSVVNTFCTVHCDHILLIVKHAVNALIGGIATKQTVDCTRFKKTGHPFIM